MEDNNETSRANLEGLPTEVFQMIAGNLSRKQLKRVRLVSRLANAKVLHVYKEKLFSNYAIFLFDQESMRQAIKVAKDPALAASIKTLSVFCSRPAIWSGVGPQNKSRSLIKQAVMEADAFDERDGPLTNLTTFLCCLRQYGKLQEVETTSDIDRECQFWGDAIYTKGPWYIDHNFDRGVETVVEALSLSMVQILKFTKSDYKFRGISTTTFNPDHCLSAFERLESLVLMSIASAEEGSPFSSEELRFVKQAQQLKNLEFSAKYEFPHSLLRTKFPLLESMAIKRESAEEGARAGPRLKDLVDFVRLHSNLVSLNLDRIDILDCSKHFRIDDEYREANEQDFEKLQEVLGVPGIYDLIDLYP